MSKEPQKESTKTIQMSLAEYEKDIQTVQQHGAIQGRVQIIQLVNQVIDKGIDSIDINDDADETVVNFLKKVDRASVESRKTQKTKDTEES